MSREHDLTDALVALEACLGVATMAMAVVEDEGALTALNTIAATIATAHHAVEAKLGDATARQEPQRPVYATMGQSTEGCQHENVVETTIFGSREASFICQDCSHFLKETPREAPSCEHEDILTSADGIGMCRSCGEEFPRA